MQQVRNVAVLGGGAWGTAFAIHVATRTHARPRVTLYVRSDAQARSIVASRENARYLPEVAVPPQMTITSDLASLHADLLFAATPVAELPALAAALPDGVYEPIPGTHMSSVTRPEFGERIAAFVSQS